MLPELVAEGEGPLPLPVKVRFSDLDVDGNFDLALDSAPKGYHAVVLQIADSGTPDWRPNGKKFKKRLPSAKILRFTLSGKSVPVPAEEIADDKLLQAHFPSMIIDPKMRGLHLATIKGGDEGARQYLQERFPCSGDLPPAG